MRALLASPLGFLIGVSLGALGGGGSILAVPALVYAAGQGPKAATTTSLVLVSITAVIGIIPLLATLAMWRVVEGVEMLITNNVNVPVTSDFISWIADGRILFLPVPVVILLVSFAGFYLLIERTPLGYQVRATGGNADAAIQSGINVRRYTILTYVLASLAVAIASVIIIGRVSGSVRGIGPLMLLDILLAAYVSAMFSRRWVINIPGVLLGADFVRALTNGLTLPNIPTYWVPAEKGGLILIVVAATTQQRQREASR